MSHRSFPPSHFRSAPRLLAVLTTHPPARATPPERRLVGPTERLVRGGKVLFYPCPGGAVRIVGLSESGEWIAEFACRERDFSEKYIRRMEQHVATTTGVRIAVLG